MIRLLLLTCGTNANYHISKLLKEKYGNKFYIIGTDINRKWEIPTSPYIDVFYQVPLTSDESYYHVILDVCEKEKIDYLLPSYDADQQLFYEGNKDLVNLGVKSLGIDRRILEVYRSKEMMNDFLFANELPIPRIYSVSDIEADKEYFVKPKNGVGSLGVKIMKGADVTPVIADKNIIEELCSEPEITLECFYYHAIVYSIARRRLASKSGVCTKAFAYYDEELTAIAQRFARALTPPHIFNLQFMKDNNGNWAITDVNLRSAGGMSLSYASGWDEVSALANMLLGNADEDVVKWVKPINNPQYIMRAYTDIVTKRVRKKIAFDLDGTLLDSRKRHQVVMDFVLQENGIVLDTGGLVSFKAEGNNNISWLITNGVDRKKAKEIQSQWIDVIEKESFLKTDVLYKGVINYLQALSIENDLFLITARNNEKATMSQIKELGLEPYFADIRIVSSNSDSAKAKAEYIKQNSIDVMIGDTEIDLKASQIAGCDFKASCYGFRSEKYWNKYNVELFKLS